MAEEARIAAKLEQCRTRLVTRRRREPIMTNEYLVVSRQGQWWIIFHGRRIGPHKDTLTAEKPAILLAQTDAKLGQDARVTVEMQGLHVVYPHP